MEQRTDEEPRQPVSLPISGSTGGALPGVDLDCSAELIDIMELGASDDPVADS
jgi:hypothetical protein